MRQLDNRFNVSRQRGISLLGLVFWAFMVCVIGWVLIRSFPTVNEYYTIKRAVQKIAQTKPTTVSQVRDAFDKQKEIEYSIVSISGKDLDVTKENDQLVIRFAYDKEIVLFPPVYLLLKYEGVGAE